MPTYGYRCESCRTEFDVWQRMSDQAKADCPKCGRPARRLFFPAGIVFKGAGFYKTDSRKATSGDGKAGAAASGSGTTPASSSSSSSSSSSPSSPTSSGSTSAPSTTSSSPGGD